MSKLRVLLLVLVLVFLTSCSEIKSISDTEIDDQGHLIVTYTDGSEEDLGLIQGSDGQDGINGTNGMDGTDGQDGTNGIDGVDGTNGADGTDGTNGFDGEDGVDGSDGLDGETPYIGENGNWWIGAEDTGVFAGFQSQADYMTGEFEFALAQDGISYYLVSYTGKDRYIVVPAMYNGLPVTSVGYEAFSDNDYIRQVTLPDTLKYIEDYAFFDCNWLFIINFPEGLESIGYSAFDGDALLRSVILPDTVTYIGRYAFRDNISVLELRLSSGLKTIPQEAFANLSRLTTLYIPEGVTEIETQAFWKMLALTDLYIPDSMEQIEDQAFEAATSLRYVFIPDGIDRIGYGIFMSSSGLIVDCEGAGPLVEWEPGWDLDVYQVNWNATRPV